MCLLDCISDFNGGIFLKIHSRTTQAYVQTDGRMVSIGQQGHFTWRATYLFGSISGLTVGIFLKIQICTSHAYVKNSKSMVSIVRLLTALYLRTKYPFGCISPSIRGISLKIYSSHLLRMRYTRC